MIAEELTFIMADKIGVKIEIYNSNAFLATGFKIIGERSKRKRMIEFLNDIRPVGFIFDYIEEEN
jgi:hypothetical protein